MLLFLDECVAQQVNMHAMNFVIRVVLMQIPFLHNSTVVLLLVFLW